MRYFYSSTRLRTTGMLSRIKNKWIWNNHKEKLAQKATWTSGTMSHIEIFLYVYGTLIVVSLVVLCIEKWWKSTVDNKPTVNK